MHTALRVEDGKYIAGLGGSAKASNVFMSDGVTSVEDALENLEGVTLQKESNSIASTSTATLTDVDFNGVQDIFVVTSYNQAFTYASIFSIPYIPNISFRHYHFINGNSAGALQATITSRTSIAINNGVNEDVKVRIYVRKKTS